MAAIRFRAFDDAAPALAELRGLGLSLVCVSNWDVSLAEVLGALRPRRRARRRRHLGAASGPKPDPAIFQPALRARRCSAREALYVGDTPAEDVAGGRAAGIRSLLIDRDGRRATSTRSAASGTISR